MVLWLFAKVFSAKFEGVASFGTAKVSNSRKFSNSCKFSPSKVSRYTVTLSSTPARLSCQYPSITVAARLSCQYPSITVVSVLPLFIHACMYIPAFVCVCLHVYILFTLLIYMQYTYIASLY